MTELMAEGTIDFACRRCSQELVGTWGPRMPLRIQDKATGRAIHACSGCGRSRIDLNGDWLQTWSAALLAAMVAEVIAGEARHA